MATPDPVRKLWNASDESFTADPGLMQQGSVSRLGAAGNVAPVISNVREITISTDRLEESIEFYQKYFGYQQVAASELSDTSWRQLWRLPPGISASAVLMRVGDHAEGAVRLVQFHPTSKVFIRVAFRPIDTGHAGCDMTVPDLTTRLSRLVDEGYNLASPRFSFVPPGAQATVTEAIVLGPTGERLPMVYYRATGSSEPEPAAPVYAPVVSAFQGLDTDIEKEAGFYRSLGLQITRDRTFDLSHVNEALGLPHDLRFRSLQLADSGVPYGRVSIAQFLNYSGWNVSDRSDPPNLGILMVSFRTADMSELIQRLKKSEAAFMGGPVKLNNPIYGSVSAVTLKRPNGAWLEFYGN